MEYLFHLCAVPLLLELGEENGEEEIFACEGFAELIDSQWFKQKKKKKSRNNTYKLIHFLRGNPCHFIGKNHPEVRKAPFEAVLLIKLICVLWT